MSRPSVTNPPAWLTAILAPYRANAAVAIVLGVLTLACSALLMFVSGYLISRTAQPETTLFMVMAAVAFVQVFGIGRPVLRYFERLISHDWVFRVTSSLRLALLRSIEAKAGDPASTRSIGAYVELLSDDIGHLQNLYLRVAFPTFIALALFVAATVFSGMFSLALGLCILVAGLVSAVLVPFAALLLSRPVQLRAKALRSDEYGKLTDDIMGSVEWALSGRNEQALSTHGIKGRESLAAGVAVRRITRIANLVSAIALAICAAVVIVVSAGSFQADYHDLNYIAAFAMGFFPMIEAFAVLPDALSDLPVHEEALSRIGAVVQDEQGASTTSASSAKAERDSSVEFRNVTYRYPQADRAIIHDLSMRIEPGQKVAVLGKSGAGKTTLASLLRGVIEPSSGTVLVGGAPITPESDISGLVGYIPQSPYVFDRTLRENLLLANPNATDEEAIGALASVGLSRKFESLEAGLDTRVGETGVGFSGGEAHRLGLARALLAGNDIILLDEPFTALDPVTERMLVETLLSAFVGKTLIVITHHLTHVSAFDRAVFIEDGAVTIDGDPAFLAEHDEKFQELLAFDRGL